MSRKLMFVVNVDWFFISHRLPIALGALAEGYEVHVACGDTGRLSELEGAGLVVHRLGLARGAAGLVSSISSFLEIFSLFRRVRPDIVHLVTIKPVLFGGVAARLAGIRSVVAAISGLGFIFAENDFVARCRRGGWVRSIGSLWRKRISKSFSRIRMIVTRFAALRRFPVRRWR